MIEKQIDGDSIIFHKIFRGVITAAIVMIPYYIGMWLIDIEGLSGMMNDDSYPASLFILPFVAAIFSGVIFWLVIFPICFITRLISNYYYLSKRIGGCMSIIIADFIGSIGYWFFMGNDLRWTGIYGIYFALGAGSFWLRSAYMNSDSNILV